MLLPAAVVFLPVVIILVMSRIFGDLLLKDGERNKIIIFSVLCVLLYAVLIYLVAQVHNQ
jgi:hypothetical protein